MGFNVIAGEKEFLLNQEDLNAMDIIALSEDSYQVIGERKNYSIQVISKEGKNLHLLVNGQEYTINIQDEYDLLVKKMGLGAVTSQKLSSVKAPMPGLILDILVSPGDEVAEGDALAILEAMKMENVLKASGDGVVKSIEVQKGDAVEKGQVLIEMD